MKRARISSDERSWRSQLAQIVSQQPFLRASLQVRKRVCGKPNCRCSRGEKHSSLYLVCGHQGVRRQLFVPRDQEDEVRQWVANYQRAVKLLEQISETAWSRVGSKEP